MENNTSKKSFLLYYDSQHLFNMLADTQAGKLIKAIYDYEINGIVPNCDDDIAFKMAFTTIQLCLDREKEKYNSVCERNKRNIQKRWNDNTTNTTGKTGIPEHTNEYKDIPNNTTVSNGKEFNPKNTENIQNQALITDTIGKIGIPTNTKNTTGISGIPKNTKNTDNDSDNVNDNDIDNDSDIDNVNDSDKDNESVNDIVNEIVKKQNYKNSRNENKEKTKYTLSNGKTIYYENIGELKKQCDCINCNANALFKIDNKCYCYDHFNKQFNN